MKRMICIPFVATALTFMPCASYAADYSQCRLTCAAEKDSRNMECPAPADVHGAGMERVECLKENEEAYRDCIKHCPTPPLPPEQVAPPHTLSY